MGFRQADVERLGTTSENENEYYHQEVIEAENVEKKGITI